MTDVEFRSLMCMAQTLGAYENVLYWQAYQRGLRRAYHGPVFGTDAEHELLTSLTDDRGRGYRDGLEAGK